MTPPTEDEVRAHLEREAATMERSAETARMVRFDDSTHMRLAAIYRSALAMLDEARKDKERLEWVLSWLLDKHWTVGHLLGGDVAEMTTAIDQAREEENP